MALFENFPYSNEHQLNLDWIVKIAKDFLDQYSNIQNTITEGLESLDSKAQELEALLQQWYDTHSEDIANQLAVALSESLTTFNRLADEKAEQTIASIPSDYSTLAQTVSKLNAEFNDAIINNTLVNNENLSATSGAGASTTAITTRIGRFPIADHNIEIGDTLRFIAQAFLTNYPQTLTDKMFGVYFYTENGTLIGERHRYTFPVDATLIVPSDTSYFDVFAVCTAPNAGVGGYIFGATNVIITIGTYKYVLSGNVQVTKESIRETDLPLYYDNYIANKIATIREKNVLCGRHGDTFIFLTDPHWKTNAKHSLSMAEQIMLKSNSKTLICGGDILNQQHTKQEALDILWDFTTKSVNIFKNNYRYIVGNHERNTMASSTPEEDQLSWSEVYSICMEPFQNDVNIYGTTDIESFIYYWDNPRQKIRYIVLNGGTAIQYSGNYVPLDNIIRNTPNGYRIGVFGHGFFTAEDVLSTTGTYVAGMLNAVNGRTSYTVYGTTFDYSDFENRNIEIMFAIGGHRHKDQYLKTANGVPIIGVTTDNYTQDLGGLNRPVNTINEQAFDVVNVDTEHRIIYLTRVGAGNDRQYTWNTTN